MEPAALGWARLLNYPQTMALTSLTITAITAMRARDVSRPSKEQQEAADRRPLRDEAPRKEIRKKP